MNTTRSDDPVLVILSENQASGFDESKSIRSDDGRDGSISASSTKFSPGFETWACWGWIRAFVRSQGCVTDQAYQYSVPASRVSRLHRCLDLVHTRQIGAVWWFVLLLASAFLTSTVKNLRFQFTSCGATFAATSCILITTHYDLSCFSITVFWRSPDILSSIYAVLFTFLTWLICSNKDKLTRLPPELLVENAPSQEIIVEQNRACTHIISWIPFQRLFSFLHIKI
jgi:hypothetical protein